MPEIDHGGVASGASGRGPSATAPDADRLAPGRGGRRTPQGPADPARWLPASALTIFFFVTGALEGFDLAVYGVSLPRLLGLAGLGVTKTSGAMLGWLVALGMLAGAATTGAIQHRTGPRRLLLASIVTFSLGMVVCAVAPGVTIFGIGRLIVGLGLGVTLPTANSYAAELAPGVRRARSVAMVMAGYALGALAAPLLGVVILPHGSFRWLYAIAVVPAVILLLMAGRLPESPVHLVRTGRHQLADRIAEHYRLDALSKAEDEGHSGRMLGLGGLLQGRMAIVTVLFWALSFCGLLLVFGLSTWLPTIMQAHGFSIGSALLLTAAMWLGAMTGMLVGGSASDRFGAKWVVVAAFAVGTVSLFAISAKPATGLLYVLMFISGFGFIGTQALVNAFIVTRYPDSLRGNGIAWALAVGRLGAICGPQLGGMVLASSWDPHWHFWIFAVPAVVGAICAVLVPGVRRENPVGQGKE